MNKSSKNLKLYHNNSNNDCKDLLLSENLSNNSKVKTKNQIQNDLEIISRPKTLYTHEMKHYSNPNGDSYNYIYLGESAGLDIYVAERNNSINYFYTDKNDDFSGIVLLVSLFIIRTPFSL